MESFDWSSLDERQDSKLGPFSNFSSQEYNDYILSLDPKTTGCYQRGVLPVPLALDNTCLPGFHCKWKINCKTKDRLILVVQVRIQTIIIRLNSVRLRQSARSSGLIRRHVNLRVCTSPRYARMATTAQEHHVRKSKYRVPKVHIVRRVHERH